MVEVPTDNKLLFLAEPYGLEADPKAERLLEELKTEFAHQFDHCELYRRICATSGWAPSNSIEDIVDLPFLPAQYFKEIGEHLVSVPSGARHRSLQSSGTSERPSTVVIDQDTSRRQVRALASVLGSFIGKRRRPFLVCDVDPGSQRIADLPARIAAIRGILTFATSSVYALGLSTEGHLTADLDEIEGFAERAQAADEPVCIAGFTYLLYTGLLDPLSKARRSFQLPNGSAILHLGGWKRLQESRVDHDTIKALGFDVFGVSAEHVVDIYGFTEQMGTCHAECHLGRKHTPVYSDVIVRDPISMAPMPDGEVGAGQFVSLVSHSYPGFSVLTDDLIRIIGADDCDCGRLGRTFEVLGRDDAAEIRGCGDVLAEKVFMGAAAGSAHDVASKGGRQVQIAQNRAEIVFSSMDRSGSERTARNFVENFEDLEQGLRAAQAELDTLSVDEIVGIFNCAANVWSDRTGPFGEYHRQGLSFLINFIRSGRLQAMLDESLRGNRKVIDGFAPRSIGGGRLRAVPRGIVVHWLAGNVPTLGIISLMMSLATKNANLVKVPSSGAPVLTELLRTIDSVQYRSRGGRVVEGGIVSRAVVAVSVPRTSPLLAEISSMADVRVAWGGAEAVETVMALPRRYDAQDIVFGPKLSAAVVGREALDRERGAKRVARGVATDCSAFDQDACASAHTIFVERGGNVSPERFAEILSEQMEQAVTRIPPGNFSSGTTGGIKSARARHFLDGTVYVPEKGALSWTVLVSEGEGLSAPVYGRTAVVRPIDEIEVVPSWLNRDVQAVGLALPGPRRQEVANRMAEAGVDRITVVGQMTEFTSPWDGIFPVEKMIRWISLV